MATLPAMKNHSDARFSFRCLLPAASAMALGMITSQALAADGKGMYQTLHFVSCETYAKDRKEPVNTGQNALDQMYVSGWLSGYNYLTPNTYEIIPNYNIDTVMQWLDNYCSKAPSKNLESALLQLTDELYPKRIQTFTPPADEKPAADTKPAADAKKADKSEKKK